MDILKDIINEKGADLIGSLTKAGFAGDIAKYFLSEAGTSMISAIGSGNVDLSSGSVDQKSNALLNNIDPTALATKVGINKDLASKGLAIIAPVVIKLLQDKLGDNQGLLGMLGAAKSSGVGDVLKKLF
ncbi:MAG: hypothetical protein AB1810_14330 [Pseudomonadota bacterium]